MSRFLDRFSWSLVAFTFLVLVLSGCAGSEVEVEDRVIVNSSWLNPDTWDPSVLNYIVDSSGEMQMFYVTSKSKLDVPLRREDLSVLRHTLIEGTLHLVCDAEEGAVLRYRLPISSESVLAVSLGRDGIQTMRVSDGDVVTVVNCYVFQRDHDSF